MLERYSFLIQAVIFLSYIPITFIAYRLLREPQKRRRAHWELSQVAEEGSEEYEQAISTANYELKEYIIPLSYITLALGALYAMTHPLVIETGVWNGLLEGNVGLLDTLLPGGAQVIYGRFLYWGWIGAYIYSVERTIRHYLTNDLSPSVYIAATKRFVVAFVVGAILSIAFTVLANVNQPFAAETTPLLAADTQLVLVYMVTFISGLIPERGMRWLVANSGKALGQRQSENEQRLLTEIEGISYWHRGRLEDEGIENVQNLATAHLLTLIVRTPYDVGQVVDWTDQAILLTYATPDQAGALAGASLRRASDVLALAAHDPALLATVSSLSPAETQALTLTLQRAANIAPITRFRRLSAIRPEAASAGETLPLREELTVAEPEGALDVPIDTPDAVPPASPALPS
jgi:hypothetical protein